MTLCSIFKKSFKTYNYLRFCCARVCAVCVCLHVCARVCPGVCYFCVCLLVCVAEAQQYPCSLGSKPFETRDLVPYMYGLEHCHICDLTIVWKNACHSKTTQPNRDFLVSFYS